MLEGKAVTVPSTMLAADYLRPLFSLFCAGFKVGGQQVAAVNGAVHGQGVYTSDDSSFAMYVRVCAHVRFVICCVLVTFVDVSILVWLFTTYTPCAVAAGTSRTADDSCCSRVCVSTKAGTCSYAAVAMLFRS